MTAWKLRVTVLRVSRYLYDDNAQSIYTHVYKTKKAAVKSMMEHINDQQRWDDENKYRAGSLLIDDTYHKVYVSYDVKDQDLTVVSCTISETYIG